MTLLAQAVEAAQTLPWAELFPFPETPVVGFLALFAGFWYGYRHPEGH